MPSHLVVTTLSLFACCPAMGSILRGAQEQLQPLAGLAQECEGFDQVRRLHVTPLLAWNQSGAAEVMAPAFSCHVAPNTDRDEDGSGASCSPVCTEALDVVVVMGGSEWAMEETDVADARRSAMDLLKHFSLSRSRASLFGFIDVSRGIEKAVRVSPLSDNREALIASLKSWKPKTGGKPVTIAHLQGVERRPEVLSMLKTSRPSVRRTLLVLQPPAKPQADASTQPNHLGGQIASKAKPAGVDPFAQDKEIMELLVSTCPAVRIDPNLKCGRMRWGHGSSGVSDKIKPWGSQKK